MIEELHLPRELCVLKVLAPLLVLVRDQIFPAKVAALNIVSFPFFCGEPCHDISEFPIPFLAFTVSPNSVATSGGVTAAGEDSSDEISEEVEILFLASLPPCPSEDFDDEVSRRKLGNRDFVDLLLAKLAGLLALPI
jgi:hypothetical protein